MAAYSGLSSRAIIGDFYQAYETNPLRMMVEQLAFKINSDQESEEYKWLGQAPTMREWKDERVAKQLRENTYTLRNKIWESTVDVDVDDLRRDKTSQIRMRVQDMASRAAEHPVKLLSDLVLNGHTGTCYDGQFFFDTDHATGSSGTQINLLTAAQVQQLNVGTATAPTESEAALAVMNVIGYMMSYLDDQGEPMNDGARRFGVMCGPTLAGPMAAAVYNATVNNGNGSATPNTMKNFYQLELFPTARLSTWTTDFCVFRLDAFGKPFIWQEELPLQVNYIGEGSEYAINTNKVRWAAKSVYNAGYGLWQYAAKATLS